MPTPVREPSPKTLLTSVNTESETLKTSSPFPQCRFHSHHFTTVMSLTGPYFGAISLQTSSTLPGMQSTAEKGNVCPQKAPGPTRGGRPCSCPGPAPPGPAAAPSPPDDASGRCPVGLPSLRLAYGTPLPMGPSATLTPVSER